MQGGAQREIRGARGDRAGAFGNKMRREVDLPAHEAGDPSRETDVFQAVDGARQRREFVGPQPLAGRYDRDVHVIEGSPASALYLGVAGGPRKPRRARRDDAGRGR